MSLENFIPHLPVSSNHGVNPWTCTAVHLSTQLNYNTGEQKWQRKKVKAKKAVSEARKNNFMD